MWSEEPLGATCMCCDGLPARISALVRPRCFTCALCTPYPIAAVIATPICLVRVRPPRSQGLRLVVGR